MQEAVAAAEAPAPDEDLELSAIFQKNNPIDPPEPEPEPTAEPVAEPVQKVEVPSEVPKYLKERWKNFDEDTRKDLLTTYREQNSKLAEQGREVAEQRRMVQGIAPIRDVLVQAVKEFPALASMKPEDVGREVFELVKISAQFRDSPVDAILGLVEKHQLTDALKEKLGSGTVSDSARTIHALQQEIKALKDGVSQFQNPEYLQSQVMTVVEQSRLATELQNFAQSKEHWGAVEGSMPAAIQFARAQLGQDASAMDVVARAYDLAVSQIVPESRASAEVAQATQQPDPAKAEAAKKAKQVNVSGGQTGSAREPSEDELLRAVYRKAQNS